MSDEEDYMSDKFLQGFEKYTPPSLINKHSDKRELEIMKRKAVIEAKLKERNKSIVTLEKEKREEGLSVALESSNKGFEMLMKMGYKPGQGIGKQESGIIEPIGVELKSNRQGLGKTTMSATTKCKTNSEPSQALENTCLKDFRERMATKKTEQTLKIDLFKSQKICEQLDVKSKLEEPREKWFWIKVKKEEKEEDSDSSSSSEESTDEDESIPLVEKLEIITQYLRDKYFYCIWCGTAYDDRDDLKDNCPGNTRNEH